jgi:hypothetical protein
MSSSYSSSLRIEQYIVYNNSGYTTAAGTGISVAMPIDEKSYNWDEFSLS